MSSPEPLSPEISPVHRRRWWPIILVVVTLFLTFDLWLIFWWFLTGKTSASRSAAATSPGAAEPVALADFADQVTRRWGTVPRGTQVCDGVTFICEGAIRTAGLRAARDGKTYPGAVLDVPVRRRGARIHLLQSSENSLGAIAGAPYGRMALHYTNGQTHRIDLLFAAHGRDWMHNPRDPDQPVVDENTTVGWSEVNPRNGILIRFHHASFTNPLPDVEITSADFIAPLHSANLLLFGLTVDNDSRPLAAPWQPGDTSAIPATDRITVTLQDPAGQPLPGAALAWTAIAPRGQVDFPPLRADTQGRVPLEFQRGALQQIRYTATTADGKTINGELQPDATGNFSPSATITLGP
jgi:hypothetical protein